MCRSIKPLYNYEPAVTDDEVHAAARQFVRKVSGFAKPSMANEATFNHAIDEIAHITRHMLEDLVTSAAPKSRQLQ